MYFFLNVWISVIRFAALKPHPMWIKVCILILVKLNMQNMFLNECFSCQTRTKLIRKQEIVYWDHKIPYYCTIIIYQKLPSHHSSQSFVIFKNRRPLMMGGKGAGFIKTKTSLWLLVYCFDYVFFPFMPPYQTIHGLDVVSIYHVWTEKYVLQYY